MDGLDSFFIRWPIMISETAINRKHIFFISYSMGVLGNFDFFKLIIFLHITRIRSIFIYYLVLFLHAKYGPPNYRERKFK